ncbi:THAP domain-containing protein 5-like [Helicoverpa zea]|uniref:THAP domain-containing protein 5-like n=1 Tax=Helicoverpa zea TaxID=7113 RepID=UPI001F57CEF1|nr:THAP domain-containing protein 5-like [Helicoverpa zea]
MPSCVLRKCKNYGSKKNKSVGVSYHTFPTDDYIKHSIVQAERSEFNWIPTKSSTICSEHFKNEDKYTTSKGYTRLKKTAVPVMAPDNDDVPQFRSPTSLDHVDISDMDSVFDTSRKAKLRTRVRKLVVEKKCYRKKIMLLKSKTAD